MKYDQIPHALMPRERLMKYGSSSLSNSELLAIFLRTGSPERDVLQLSEYLLQEFGSLRALFNAERKKICSYKGIGFAKYSQFQAMLELYKRYLEEVIAKGDVMANPKQTKLYLSSILRDRRREVFLILHLDNQHRLIENEILFEGTINAASVYPRDIVKSALDKHAAALILAHNHPSGLAEPSQADQNITKTIINALSLVEIRVLDHFVIGDGEIVSFAERGWI